MCRSGNGTKFGLPRGAALASGTLAGLMRMPSVRDRIIPLLQWPFTLAVAAMCRCS